MSAGRGAGAAPAVLIDGLSANLGGGIHFLARELAALERVAPDQPLVVLTAPWNHEPLAEATGDRARLVRLRGTASRLAYEQLVLPGQTGGARLLYCPGNLVPLLPGRRSPVPCVVALQNPNMVGAGRAAPHNRRWRRRLQAAVTRRSLEVADRVVVISQHLHDEVLADHLVDPARLRLVPSGAPEPVDEALVPDGFPFPQPGSFLLVLANDAPHKNLDVTVDAWATAMAGRADPLALVVAGWVTPARQAAQRSRLPHALRGRLVHLDHVTDRRQVRWLLEHARALVASAALEAHPLTPAEAGAAGCPLVLSDIPPHREIADGHATFVPVGDRAALAAVLAALPGGEPASWRPERWHWPVTWDDHARALLAVFDEVAP